MFGSVNFLEIDLALEAKLFSVKESDAKECILWTEPSVETEKTSF